jgi:transcriptional regulator
MIAAMYVPDAFRETRPERLRALMRDHPLGALVTATAKGLDANHLPFEFVEGPGPLGTLRTHVARANPVWQELAEGDRVLVIFSGPQAYVSPNWYPSKHETHRLVPTWNYEVVHAHGLARIVDGERFVRGVVSRLTRHHEAQEPRPWKMGDSAPAFIDELLGKIVGLDVEITELVGKSKLSQNREERDRLGAAATLEAKGAEAIARAMREG